MKNNRKRKDFAINGIAFWSLLFLSIVTSCQEKKPKDVLSHEEMVTVLTAIYIAEEKVNRLGLRTDSAKKVFEYMEGKVFETTGVPDSVFKKSFDYYMNRPRQLEKIYTILVDSLSLREQRAPYRPDQE